ncbi:PREDICTED: uncharacterized protein LOC109161506 isoform X1 [Ipomoea nil]|uniref:uncharacterized protein LOC109161506 isoform X1 n=1 Tax=Ipomoea nil TaxID=35883 RepID=UPI000900E527|nr:PREDICTED: uncharacterized protein LOC109161506 isoform X1 [Ipomoea nil]
MAMATDIQYLETRYFNSCRESGVVPNHSVLSALFKVRWNQVFREPTILVIVLDDMGDVDFQPLLELLREIDASDIDAVDIITRSTCTLSGDRVILFLRAVSRKLRVVDLQDILFGKDFLLDLAQHGLTCQVLNLRSSHFRKLNMAGSFLRMHTLNLDFSASLSNFREDCFTCMPNLKCLSLCETRISNLWTTSAALAKLPSLVELRFQNRLHSVDTWQYPASSGRNNHSDSGHLDFGLHLEVPRISGEGFAYRQINVDNEDISTNRNHDLRSMSDDSSDHDSDVDFYSQDRDLSFLEQLPDLPPVWNDLVNLQNEISFGTWGTQNDEASSSLYIPRSRLHISSMRHISRHSSPICYEKHYREYMIASLPNLKILDNLHIGEFDRERANFIFKLHFEYLPYKRTAKEGIISILQKREVREKHSCTFSSRKKLSYQLGNTQHCYSRSLSAAKVGSCAWPAVHPLCISGNTQREERRGFRPRQFEYHPSDASLMVFGTLDGEVVVLNHESEKVIGHIPSLGAMNSVLGLCWLKKHPSKVIAGSDNGLLRLYDIQCMTMTTTGAYQSASSVTFDDFDQLTSVHANSTDELFLASGYSKHVALYDISSGKRLQVFDDMHQEHINVVKFSNHSPSIFATSSFDQDVKLWDLRQKPIHPCYTASSSRGNVMVCFSPDDHYLLVSAVDNEVKQLLAVDGRLHLDFGIASTGSSQNYTRSYYMNGRDYVISGSCDEHVIRICCAQTGRRLRDVSLEGKGSGASMFVQSLRGDPFRDFNMSFLAAYTRPSSVSEIVKVNLLASNDQYRVRSHHNHPHPSFGSGG